MVTVRAFKAIRPDEKKVSQVATLPYDVLDSDEARDLAQGNPFSFLHIDKSEIDLPANTDSHSQIVYDQAATNLADFINKGWLKKEDKNELYLYELTMDGRTQTGLVATTAVAEYNNGDIKKHEFTLPEKEQDRINHFKTTMANTSPIFLTYRAKDDIQNIMGSWKNDHDPIYDFVSFYNVRHRVFAINDNQTINELQFLFQTVPSLYIADGHHRSASAANVGQILQTNESKYFLSVIFPDTELQILDYNRLVYRPLGSEFWKNVAQKFDIQKIELNKPTQVHHIHAFTKSGWVRLIPKANIIPTDLVQALDVSILQNEILAPLLGIDNPKTSPHIKFVGGIRGLEELEKGVEEGASIAFALFPPSITELLAVADAGKIMPPKSTWFEPKLLSGLFLHDLKDK